MTIRSPKDNEKETSYNVFFSILQMCLIPKKGTIRGGIAEKVLLIN